MNPASTLKKIDLAVEVKSGSGATISDENTNGNGNAASMPVINDTTDDNGDTDIHSHNDGRRRSRRLRSKKRVNMTEIDEHEDLFSDGSSDISISNGGLNANENGENEERGNLKLDIMEFNEHRAESFIESMIYSASKKRKTNHSANANAHTASATTTTTTDATATTDPNYKMPFDEFDGLVLQLILSMLPTPRHLHALATTSKRIMSLVTYRHVIRSSVMRGKEKGQGQDGYCSASKCIESIVNGVGCGYLYVPSVMRLLRLANGRFCERGTQCMRYNSVTGKTPRVYCTSKNHGLWTCHDCNSILFASLKGYRHMGLFERSYSSEALYDNQMSVWEAPIHPIREQTDTCNSSGGGACASSCAGSLVGPYMTIKEISQVHSVQPRYYRSADERDTNNPTDRDRHVSVQLGKVRDGKVAEDPHASMGQTSILIKEILEEAKEDLEIMKLGDLKHSMKVHRERNMKKYAKVKAIDRYLRECLGVGNEGRDVDGNLDGNLDGDEVQGGNMPGWKQFILDCHWIDPADHEYLYRDERLVRYKCFVVDLMMHALITAPSYFTKKAIKNIAADIRQMFEAMWQNDFFSYSFLDEDDRWENVIRLVAIAELDAPSIFLRKRFIPDPWYPDADAARALKRCLLEMNYRDAIACEIGHRVYRNEAWNDVMADAFVREVHDSDPASHVYFSEENFGALTRHCYKYTRTNNVTRVELRRVPTLDHLKQTFESASVLYNDLKDSILAYLDHEATRHFIESDDDTFLIPRHVVIRRALLRRSDDFDLLQDSDYTRLLVRHVGYFMEQGHDIWHSERVRWLHIEE